MSCRHDLALTRCKVCYPETGDIDPEGDGDSLDGPGAVDREGNRLPLPQALTEPQPGESFTPPDFEFQGVRFTWTPDDSEGEYRPVNPPYDDLHIWVGFQWVDLEPGIQEPTALFKAIVSAKAPDEDSEEFDIYKNFAGEGTAQVPQEALCMALEEFANLIENQAGRILAYAGRIEDRAFSSKWLSVGAPPSWNSESR